jgi:hypothetical protein
MRRRYFTKRGSFQDYEYKPTPPPTEQEQVDKILKQNMIAVVKKDYHMTEIHSFEVLGHELKALERQGSKYVYKYVQPMWQLSDIKNIKIFYPEGCDKKARRLFRGLLAAMFRVLREKQWRWNHGGKQAYEERQEFLKKQAEQAEADRRRSC